MELEQPILSIITLERLLLKLDIKGVKIISAIVREDKNNYTQEDYNYALVLVSRKLSELRKQLLG